MSKGRGSILKVGSHKSSLSASELGASTAAAVKSIGTGDSGAMIQVKDKLKKLEGFAGSMNKLQVEAERLTKPENLRTFFSHLLDDVVGEVMDQAVLDERKRNSASLSLENPQVRLRKQQNRQQKVSNLPITLFLFCNRDHFTVDAATAPGTVTVALAVGDVLLEWCENSLVDPSYIDLECPVDFGGRILFHADVHYEIAEHALAATAADVPVFLNTAAEEVEYSLEAVTSKAQAIENVIKVISNYNRYCYFDKIARNSHRFVNDCMKALGIKQHSQYATQLNRQAMQLMQRHLDVPPVYEYHESIDEFVETERQRGRLEQLPVVNLEYLLFVYYHQFHGGDECGRPNCKMMELRVLLKERVKPIFV